ncbi:hypothetical protein K491DRAFT_673223 [Lophiostoma macrostomum CBS 122681]|uniref:Uncharacterized protein n=1 Tax=Lophiostoma macrostomum CBS 122681 TaxID=1314788 RepID=A0A6A6TT47_9PLEO|nr:hypothetical protein K491DRAFT_673223 [Lophiostoma macrostomum CBS 122681]
MNSSEVQRACAQVDQIAKLLSQIKDVLGSETYNQYLGHLYGIYKNSSRAQLGMQLSKLEDFVLSRPSTVFTHNEIIGIYNTFPQCKDKFTAVTVTSHARATCDRPAGEEDAMQDIQCSNAAQPVTETSNTLPSETFQLSFRPSPSSSPSTDRPVENWFSSLDLKDPKNIFAIAEEFGYLENVSGDSGKARKN